MSENAWMTFAFGLVVGYVFRDEIADLISTKSTQGDSQ